MKEIPRESGEFCIKNLFKKTVGEEALVITKLFRKSMKIKH